MHAQFSTVSDLLYRKMKKDDLKKLTVEELKKKEKSSKALIWIFIPIIVGLLYFSFRDYLDGEQVEMPVLIIAICSIGGMISLVPGLRAIQRELRSRN